MRVKIEFAKEYRLPVIVTSIVTFVVLLGLFGLAARGGGYFMPVVAVSVAAGISLLFLVIEWVYHLIAKPTLPSWVPFALAWAPSVLSVALPLREGDLTLPILSVAFGVHCSTLLICTRKHRARNRRKGLGLCVNCGYDLAGRSGERCPECGASVLDTTHRVVRR